MTDPRRTGSAPQLRPSSRRAGLKVKDLSEGGARSGDALAEAWAWTIAELGQQGWELVGVAHPDRYLQPVPSSDRDQLLRSRTPGEGIAHAASGLTDRRAGRMAAEGSTVAEIAATVAAIAAVAAALGTFAYVWLTNRMVDEMRRTRLAQERPDAFLDIVRRERAIFSSWPTAGAARPLMSTSNLTRCRSSPSRTQRRASAGPPRVAAPCQRCPLLAARPPDRDCRGFFKEYFEKARG